MIELLGWASSAILLATLMRQVYTQWRSGATAGLSKWLFIGQCAASVGYTVYSLLLHNWVYVSSNIAILITAIIGESLYLHNRRAALRQSRGLSGVGDARGRDPVAPRSLRPVHRPR